MSNSYVDLDAPLVKEAGPSSISGKGKALGLVSLFIGLGLIVLWSAGSGQDPGAQMPMATMAFTNVMQPTSQFRAMSPGVRNAVNTLNMYGINAGPMEKLALTAIDANNRGTGGREVAAMASRMPKNIQVWLSETADAVEEKAAEPAPPAPPPAPPAYSVKPQDLPGITPPLGYFDDWGLAAPIENEKPFSGARLLFYREAELKHGRVGMIASLGIIVGEQFHPIFGGKFEGIAVDQFQNTDLGTFWAVLTVAMALTEVLPNGNWIRNPAGGFMMDPKAIPGDLGWDPLGLKPKDPAGLLEMQNKELNNGRLGMLAAAGMIAQELVTGKATFR